MITDEEINKTYGVLRIIAFCLLIGAPLVYAGMVYKLNSAFLNRARPELPIWTILMAVALFMAVALVILHRLGTWKKMGLVQKSKGLNSVQAGQAVTIMKLAMIESLYIFGLVAFFQAGYSDNLWYFAILGVLCTTMYWPTRDRFADFVRSLEEP